jgi:hypothetical protein
MNAPANRVNSVSARSLYKKDIKWPRRLRVDSFDLRCGRRRTVRSGAQGRADLSE